MEVAGRIEIPLLTSEPEVEVVFPVVEVHTERPPTHLWLVAAVPTIPEPTKTTPRVPTKIMDESSSLIFPALLARP